MINNSKKIRQFSPKEDFIEFPNNDPISDVLIEKSLPVEMVAKIDLISLENEIKKVLSTFRSLNLKFLTSDFQTLSKDELIDKLAAQKSTLIELVISLKKKHEKNETLLDKMNNGTNEQRKSNKKNEELELDFNLEFNKRLEDFHYTNNKDQLNTDLSFLLNCQPDYKTKKISKTQLSQNLRKPIRERCTNKSEESLLEQNAFFYPENEFLQQQISQEVVLKPHKMNDDFQTNSRTTTQLQTPLKNYRKSPVKPIFFPNEVEVTQLNSFKLEEHKDLIMKKSTFKKEGSDGSIILQKFDYSIVEPLNMDFHTDNYFSFEGLSNIDKENGFLKFEIDDTFSNELVKNTDDKVYGIVNQETYAFDGEMSLIESGSMNDYFFDQKS